jgi:hypothetical protein
MTLDGKIPYFTSAGNIRQFLEEHFTFHYYSKLKGISRKGSN